MEIKEAIKEIKEGDLKTTSPKRGVAILTICQALCDGYTLCKVDEAIKLMHSTPKDYSDFREAREETVDDCVEILKEACL